MVADINAKTYFEIPGDYGFPSMLHISDTLQNSGFWTLNGRCNNFRKDPETSCTKDSYLPILCKQPKKTLSTWRDALQLVENCGHFRNFRTKCFFFVNLATHGHGPNLGVPTSTKKNWDSLVVQKIHPFLVDL